MGKYSLIIVAGFAMTFGIIRNNLAEINGHYADNFHERYNRTKSRAISHSGAQMAMVELTQDGEWRTGWTNRDLLDGLSTVEIVDSTVDTTLRRSELRVISRSTYNGQTDSSVVMWKRLAFSEYSYFTNLEPVIYFISGDTLAGPVHTNGEFHMNGSPVFEGRVTSPNNWVGTATPQFFSQADFNSDEIPLPVTLSALDEAAQNGGMEFNLPLGQALWIEFKSDGSFSYASIDDDSTPDGSTIWTNMSLNATNGVLYSDKPVHIWGTVNGEVTLGAQDNIYIEDDIVYFDDPRLGFSDDLLGLVSEAQVIVAENAVNQIDVNIHASILALDKFTVENYDQGTPRGFLAILGGLIQETRGAVGTFDGGVVTTGYLKDYQYDDRFIEEIPPYFPIAGQDSGGTPYFPGRLLSWQE